MQKNTSGPWLPKGQAPKLAHDLWQPCLFWIKLCGIYHWDSRSGKRSWGKWKFYSAACWIAVAIVSLGAVIENPLIANGFNSGLNHYNIRLLGSFLVHFQTMVSMAVFFSASNRPRAGLSAFYIYWKQLSLTVTEVRCIERSCRAWAIGATVVYLVIATLQCIVFVPQVYINTISNQLPFHTTSHGFYYFVELASGTFFLLICQSLHRLFSELNKRAVDFQQFPNSHRLAFDDYYRNYVLVVNMVEVVDEAVSPYLGSYIYISLVQLIFRTFVLIYPSDQGTSYLLFVLGFFRQFLLVSVMLWAAAMVQGQAHKSFSAFHKMDLNTFPDRVMPKVVSFRSFLGSGVVCFSLFNLQQITMGLISSLSSIYLTYTIILYQFKSN